MSHSTLDGINHDPEVGHLEDMCKKAMMKPHSWQDNHDRFHYKEMNPRETVLDQVILLLHMKVMSLRASSTSFSCKRPCMRPESVLTVGLMPTAKSVMSLDLADMISSTSMWLLTDPLTFMQQTHLWQLFSVSMIYNLVTIDALF